MKGCFAKPDLVNEFVEWLDENGEFSLRHIINYRNVEAYAVYNEKKGSEMCACDPKDLQHMISTAKKLFPLWKR